MANAIDLLGFIKELVANKEKLQAFKEIIADIKELIDDVKTVIQLIQIRGDK